MTLITREMKIHNRWTEVDVRFTQNKGYLKLVRVNYEYNNEDIELLDDKIMAETLEGLLIKIHEKIS